MEAFYFDRAVTTFGLSLESALEEAGASANNSKQAARKREMVFHRWLGTQRKYKDPAAGAAQVKNQSATVVSSEQQGKVSL